MNKNKNTSYRFRRLYPYSVDILEANILAYNWCIEKAGTFAFPYESDWVHNNTSKWTLISLPDDATKIRYYFKDYDFSVEFNLRFG